MPVQKALIAFNRAGSSPSNCSGMACKNLVREISVVFVVSISSRSPLRYINGRMSSEAVSALANSCTACLSTSSLSGILAVVRINWTRLRSMPRRWNSRRIKSETSPPEEPRYICASSMIKRSLFVGLASSQSFVSAHILFSLGRKSIYSSIE